MKNAQLSIKARRKWNAKNAVEDRDSLLRMKEVVGAVEDGRREVSFYPLMVKGKKKEKGCGNKKNSVH